MPGSTPPSVNRGGSGRRGLSPAIIILIVVDIVLVVVAVLLGISLGSDASAESLGASPSASSSATAGASAGATPAPLAQGVGVKQVASPSGNITCSLSPEGAECAIAALATEPAAVTGCAGSVGYVVTLTTSGVQTPCQSAKPGAAAAAIPVLAYGAAESVNNFECVSTESGMRCSDTNTGKGFTLARAGVTTF